MFRSMRRNLSYLVFIFVLFVAASLAMAGLQRKLLFPASKEVELTPADYGLEYEEIELHVGKHTTTAWYVPTKNPRGVVLFSHGNAGNIGHRLDTIAFIQKMGFDVMMYDYGGYGDSTGKSSEKRCYADIRAVWRYLTEDRNVEPSTIVLWGRSLGGGVTSELAAEVTPGAIVLESAFTSAVDRGKEVFPFLPVKLLLRHKFKNDEKIKQFTAPILIIHSPDDTIIPYHHGEKLFELAPEPKTFLKIFGGHNGGWMDSAQVYKAGLEKFLDPLFPE